MFDEEKGWYLLELLQQTERMDWYLSQLFSEFPLIKNKQDQSQRNDILGCLMKRGNEQAREMLEELWRKELAKDNIDSVDSFLKYGTSADYRTVLQYLEHTWKHRRKPHEDSWRLHSFAQDGIGEKQAAKVRQPFLHRNPKFARLADFPETRDVKPYQKDQLFETIEEYVSSAIRVPMSLLDESGIAKVADLIQTDLSAKQLKTALRVFNWFPFPGDIHLLLSFLEHDDEDIQYAVLNALAKVRNPLIRDAVLPRSFSPKVQCKSISVLQANFEPGDEKWIAAQIGSLTDSWHLHVARICLREVVEKHPKADWTQLLTEAYEFSACQICRHACAELLQKRRAFPVAELEAMQFDAYDHARSWSKKQLHKLNRKQLKTST